MANLEARALQQFDRLVATGEISWQETTPLSFAAEPFDFEFRIARSLGEKPWSINEKKPVAFSDTTGDFDLGPLGSKHKLILNKYCVVRPQFVLPTLAVESQEDILNEHDFEAAWLALSSLGDEYIVIFNGGAKSGASASHKHLQVIPGPGKTGLLSILGDKSRVKSVPFQFAMEQITQSSDGRILEQMYLQLREKLDLDLTSPHNVVFTSQRMLVIPRSKGSTDGIATNAAGMIGMAWCKSEEEYQGWLRHGPMALLRKLGVAKE